MTVPDAPRSSTLDSDLQGFVTEMRQTVSQSQGPFADYLSLAGKAKRMAAVPDGIQAVVRKVIEDPNRTQAPTILLLTEEVTLPWEIAVLDPPLDTTWGGSRRSSARTPRSPDGRSPRSGHARRRGPRSQ